MTNLFTAAQIISTYQQLQSHVQNIERSTVDTAETFFNGFIFFCESDEIMQTITTPLKETNVPFEEWWNDKRVWPNGSRKFELPPDQENRNAFLYQLCLKIYTLEPGFSYLGVSFDYFHSVHQQDNILTFNRSIISNLNSYFIHNLTRMQQSLTPDSTGKQPAPQQITQHFYGPVSPTTVYDESTNVSQSRIEGQNVIGRSNRSSGNTYSQQNYSSDNDGLTPIELLFEWLLRLTAPWLMEKFGKKKLFGAGLGCLIGGFFSFFGGTIMWVKSWFPVIEEPIHTPFDYFPASGYGFWILVIGGGLVLLAALLLRVPRYYEVNFNE